MIRKLIEKLYIENNLEDYELLYLLDNISEEEKRYLFSLSGRTRDLHYGKKVYLRGLIEFTNHCKRECRYCGINAFNRNVKRYRLTEDEILDTCRKGKELGFSTFVLQGGEDPFFTADRMSGIVGKIKEISPDVAVTLSIGEKTFEEYMKLKEAGADRFLLRHETADPNLYRRLHPYSRLETRMKCLEDLKRLGFQTGAGFMVGLPGYTNADYVRDLRFLKDFRPHMIGMGPFIPHRDTELRDSPAGDIEKTVLLLSIVRLLLPEVLLPATTALSSIEGEGRKTGLDVGCNVIMPNLTPSSHREDYSLYNNKKISGSESAEELDLIKKELESIGYICDMSRGDSLIK